MEHPKELLDGFAEEIGTVAKALEPIAEGIRSKPTLMAQYAAFGQIIDRIYGTAATLDYKEIANYCRALKSLTYKCSQSTNPYGTSQVKDIVVLAIPLLKKMQNAIHNPLQIRKIQYTLQKEIEKAQDIEKKSFGTIKRSSTAA